MTAYHHFERVEAAKAFAGSDRLEEVMKAAGVSSESEIWFATGAA